VVTISQSGETLDTMEALKRARELGHENTLVDLQRARERDPAVVAPGYYTRAGAEIGVALDHGFHHQLVRPLHLALAIAKVARRAHPRRRRRPRSPAALRARAASSTP
jgi:glucosamine--fructose-6-phosphate aminotransferase (isomerizing)